MKAFLGKIGKHWWVYLAWIVMAAFFWNWIFGILTQAKPEEKVSVFIGSYSNFYEKYTELNESRPDYLKTVEVNAYKVDSFYFSTYLSVFGYDEGDILILPESKTDKEGLAGRFGAITQEYLDLLPSLGYMEKNGQTYGIRVHDKATGESLVNYIDYGAGEKEEDYYLFFGKNSLHTGKMSPNAGNAERDGAIRIAQRLMTL